LLAFLFCVALAGRAQDLSASLKNCVSAVRSIEPMDTDYRDLQGLQAAVGGARIVLLGEQTHGEGSTFSAKIRLIKFLHEKMGFEVLAFESGLYDCARIWENVQAGGQLSQEVTGSLFYIYATSVQMGPLFDYLQGEGHTEHPLILTGFESQHTGVKAKTQLFDDFERWLNKRAPAMLDVEWELFRRVSISTFGSRDYRPSPEEKERIIARRRGRCGRRRMGRWAIFRA
jgi:erythromycin esterase